ncbi:hypothetical protein [Sphingorhabdus lutea]|nr:hypothetical protein [Sphingorhabdus lutea]
MPAYAYKGQKKGNVGSDAVDAATQPLNDLNLRNKEIPLILLSIGDQPYSAEGLDDCASLYDQIALLDNVLGPDADADSKKTGTINKALKVGGNVLGGFIPFRGVVRQISGANAHRAKMEDAVYAGVTRRSFLKGVAYAKNCATKEEMILQSAHDVLGMDGSAQDEDIDPFIPDNRDLTSYNQPVEDDEQSGENDNQNNDNDYGPEKGVVEIDLPSSNEPKAP